MSSTGVDLFMQGSVQCAAVLGYSAGVLAIIGGSVLFLKL